jgi:ABC-type multidrug transport system fused ATPase/permease subunit
VTLSGGQRQRISIARALLRRPDFLVLDDCTSALDVETEQAIQSALQELGPETARIVIAHRYSSIAKADRVYVLENGRIVESGAPAELNRPGTAFSRILQLEEGA